MFYKNTHIALFFIFLISLPLASQMGFITHFVLQKEYIIANKCVNKNVPELKCDGKCHLRKYVKIQQQAEDPAEDVPQLPISQLEEILSLVYTPVVTVAYSPFTRLEFFVFLSANNWHVSSEQDSGRLYSQKLLRPPSMV